MSEYLTKEEIKQWRGSLEKITLEEFARRLGKEVEGAAKKTHDIVDMYVNKEPISTTIVPDVIKKPETKRFSRLIDEVTKSDDEVTKRAKVSIKDSIEQIKQVQPQKVLEKTEEKTSIISKDEKEIMPIIEKKSDSSLQNEEKNLKVSRNTRKTQIEELFYEGFSLSKKLTEREILVLDCLMGNSGTSVKAQELAEKLNIPRDYIYKYIKNLRKKLQNVTIGNSEEGGFILEK